MSLDKWMEKELSEEEARRAKGGEGGLKRYASGLPTAKQLAEMEREEASREPRDVFYSLLDYWIEAERSKRLDEFAKKKEE
jgi:hypothetical protein